MCGIFERELSVIYRVLYRKWRPKVFSDVIGQPHVTVTLSSQVKENRLSHAYLFTGSRGTGKTTCAKILSKAVNCLNSVDGNPCNECEICKGIDSGSILDIVEIDAASNRGIEDIRALREEVNFTPSQAKYRVYIIDEVHMLTIEAFNALLKTLEEPPEHVKFILATTEVHKLPATILSRCQRFDFRRIEPSFIAERLEYIATQEGASLQHDAAMLIARIADGGMRDALSLLDRCISVENSVGVDTVSSCAGLMGREHIYSLIKAIADEDTAKCLTIVDELHKNSCDTERLITELIERFRSFLIVKTVNNPENLLVCTARELEEIKEISLLFSKEAVLYALNVLTGAADAIKRTQNRRIEAEMALIRLSRPENDDSAAALTLRIANLEKELSELKKSIRSGEFVSRDNSEKPVFEKPKESIKESFDKNTEISQVENSEADLPFTEDVPFPEEVPFDEDVPFNEDVPFDEDIPPVDDMPFSEDVPFADNTPKNSTPEFKGFSEESGSSTFADMFSQDKSVDDDDGFDFDAFMREHEGAHKKADKEDSPVASENQVQNSSYSTVNYSQLFEETLPDNNAADKIDNHTWAKIILETEKAFPPLIGQLTGSYATIKGNVIHIVLGEKNLKLFVNEQMLGKYVSQSAEKVIGKTYNVKID